MQLHLSTPIPFSDTPDQRPAHEVNPPTTNENMDKLLELRKQYQDEYNAVNHELTKLQIKLNLFDEIIDILGK